MTDAEITRIADTCCMYECHDNGRIDGNTVLDFAHAILAAQLAAPVLTECRHCGFRVALNEAPQGEGK